MLSFFLEPELMNRLSLSTLNGKNIKSVTEKTYPDNWFDWYMKNISTILQKNLLSIQVFKLLPVESVN